MSWAKKEAARAVLKQMNDQFTNIYGTSFDELVTKIPEVNLKVKESILDRKKKLQKTYQKVKSSIEESRAKVDSLTFYGTRQSKSMCEKQRMALHFESRNDATTRSQKRSKIFFNS